MTTGIFTRQAVKKYRRYSTYKKYLIVDFKKTCAYCLIPQTFLGGMRHFDIDHYEPQNRAPSLIAEYSNLFWSCKRCNGEKSDKWPDPVEIMMGCRFFDGCIDDPKSHYIFEDDGILMPISDIGFFTLNNLELNDPDTVQIRRRIIRLSHSKSVTIDWNLPLDDIINLIEP